MLKIQIFGGRGAGSGGSYKGTTKTPDLHKPNSIYTWFKNNKPYQKRWYDSKGHPKKDKDYTDHGNSKKHPVVPHYHDWIEGKHGDGYWIDKNGNKHYFKE